jgi:hypothetical protein
MIKSRRLRLVGYVACMGEGRSAYRVLVGKPEGKRPFGVPSLRGEGGIKINLKEMWWDAVEWINLACVGAKWTP